MVRKYKKKKRTEFVEQDMLDAIKAVMIDKMSYRVAADVYSVHHTTLFRRLQKINSNAEVRNFSSKYTSRQVFTLEQEETLKEYIIQCCRLSYKVGTLQIRKLGYNYAEKLNRDMPITWRLNTIAGVDWYKNFMRRHNLNLRKSFIGTGATGTNKIKSSILDFQQQLSEALMTHNFAPDRIINLDETGVTTAVQVDESLSAASGSLVTICGIITASGGIIPPVFVFPEEELEESLMEGAPGGSMGLGYHTNNGWMTDGLFVQVLQHIQEHTGSSKEEPILIIMDNHETHCSIDAVIYAKENGMVLLTIPPQCSPKLQPLDIAVMGNFKGRLMLFFNNWMTANPGRRMEVADLARLAFKAFAHAFTEDNIIEGFKEAGIIPFSSSFVKHDELVSSKETENPESLFPYFQETTFDISMKRPNKRIKVSFPELAFTSIVDSDLETGVIYDPEHDDSDPELSEDAVSARETPDDTSKHRSSILTQSGVKTERTRTLTITPILLRVKPTEH